MSEEKKKGLDGRLLRRIISYLEPYKIWVGVAFITVLVVAFLGPLRPKLVQITIDQDIVTGDLEGLRNMIMLLFGILVAEGLLSFVNAYLTQWIGQQAIYDLRTKLYRHIQRQSLRFFDTTPIGRLITRVTSDVESLSQVLSAGVVTILGDLFKLIFISWFMFSLNWELALLTLAVMPLMVYATFWFKRKVRVAYRETRTQVARLNSFLQEHISGMKIVQLFGREEEEMNRFKAINDEHRQAHIRTIFYYALFFPLVDLVATIALGLVIWFGGLNAMQGTLTLGVLIAFIQYARQFFEPIRNLSDQFNTLQSAMAGAERIFDLLDSDLSISEEESPVDFKTVDGRIEFRNVWFSYDPKIDSEDDEADWILRDVSFSVNPGQSLAIVGATGAGKSTVINLLLRFYDIQRGSILVDGVDITSISLADLRSHIGLVLQDVFLFSGTIRDNITLRNDEITDERMKRAAASIGASAFIERFSAQYDYEVRERGMSLSHGQRQLLSFVRALVYAPRILVLDEATSSVDTETEEAIQNALERLMKDRTSVAIAHRLSTIQHADKILVMHRGQVRESGSHQELISQDGLYRKLYELQYQEQKALA
ncbi:MAG: ABC transporter ATP-binding protein [Bacteroidetes Order II. Incertae sedis bacterium]|nr:ABC transporter ATP-binding protein [Bacteroidetes Order II. bacterium]MBT4603324.1 ABC transporter ATP-binding protein [Bacteroidetes Order II. bacterium]MBT5250115.1 ABC transporter ATP-binding protein [Bacteroidetes Order II. bacterium]MBT6201844.1 ABC transporter ATP-binding protein [Bacteroidetes Order II. bacterium]MBT6424414.1 ABC transporter ATP-binding protein [Bacteroidetes Order II. bacterium]